MTIQELIDVLDKAPNKNLDVRLIVTSVEAGGRVYRIHADLEKATDFMLFGTDEQFNELMKYETTK